LKLDPALVGGPTGTFSGGCRKTVEKNESEELSFRFQGQHIDIETGLYYNRFRYYMPDEGIYTQRDPIGLLGGNPTVYGYSSNSLVNSDPFGLQGIYLFRGDNFYRSGQPIGNPITRTLSAQDFKVYPMSSTNFMYVYVRIPAKYRLNI